MAPRERLSVVTYADAGRVGEARAVSIELYGPTDDERRARPRDPARMPYDGAAYDRDRNDPLSRPEPKLPDALAHAQKPLF